MSAAIKHPIAVVTRRTGLSADVIRAWEKRHHVVEPSRTPGNRRLYSDADIRRLRLLREALDAGWQIGQVAALDDHDLTRIVAASPGRNLPRRQNGRDLGRPAEARYVDGAMRALIDLDGEALRRELERASVELSRIELLDRLLVPLIERIGESCATGELRTANEHLASAVIRSFLDSLRSAFPAAETAPGLIVTTPAFQYHELGALLVAATGRMEGWKTTYLGPNLPAEEIVAAARARRPRAVALSIVFPGDDSRVGYELLRLGRMIDDEVILVAGGQSAAGYQRQLDEIGATRLKDLTELRELLHAARQSPPASSRS